MLKATDPLRSPCMKKDTASERKLTSGPSPEVGKKRKFVRSRIRGALGASAFSAAALAGGAAIMLSIPQSRETLLGYNKEILKRQAKKESMDEISHQLFAIKHTLAAGDHRAHILAARDISRVCSRKHSLQDLVAMGVIDEKDAEDYRSICAESAEDVFDEARSLVKTEKGGPPELSEYAQIVREAISELDQEYDDEIQKAEAFNNWLSSTFSSPRVLIDAGKACIMLGDLSPENCEMSVEEVERISEEVAKINWSLAQEQNGFIAHSLFTTTQYEGHPLDIPTEELHLFFKRQTDYAWQQAGINLELGDHVNSWTWYQQANEWVEEFASLSGEEGNMGPASRAEEIALVQKLIKRANNDTGMPRGNLAKYQDALTGLLAGG